MAAVQAKKGLSQADIVPISTVLPAVSSPAIVPPPEPVKDASGKLPQAGEKMYRVDLGSHGPKSRHWAKDVKAAWEEYRKKHGIIASDHPASIEEVDPAVPDEKPDRLKQVKAEHKAGKKNFPTIGEFDEKAAELEIAELRG